jgi:transcriptional regulator with XRE-family HTH domain
MSTNGDDPRLIGQRIREARLRAGLTQRALKSPGVSNAYISRIEAGERTPSMKALRQLAPKLGVSVEWLETGEEARRFAAFSDPELDLIRRALEQSGSAARELCVELRDEQARRSRS